MRAWAWLIGLLVLGACTNDFDALAMGGASATGTGGSGAAPGGGGPSTSGSGAVDPQGSSTGSGGMAAAGGGPGATGGGGSGVTSGSGGSDPVAVCGDTIQTAPEECDDGNTTPGDGCGATCLDEFPDTCPGTPIPMQPGTLVISATTENADDTMQDTGGVSPCAGDWPGGDLIYAVTPSTSGQLTVTLDADFFSHYLRARESCPSGPVFACDYATFPDANDVISFGVTAGTTYWIVVDSWNSTSGGFTLTLQL